MSTTIHIIDSSKPSLVMTSEVFKDKIPGSIVSFSLNAKDGITHLQGKPGKDAPDLVVVDFDLPDADGVSLVRELRKHYKGPIFLTAFASDVVKQAVAEELFHYNDSCEWIAKPVRSKELDQRIEQFIFNRYRLGRRFPVQFTSLLVGKGEGRGKRAPKFDGKVINLSIGGVCVSLGTAAKIKNGEEFLITMAVPEGKLEGAGPVDSLKPLLAAEAAQQKLAAKSGASKITIAAAPVVAAKPSVKGKAMGKASAKSAKVVATPEPIPAPAAVNKGPVKFEEYKIKATVAWLADGGKTAGLNFGKISDQQRRQIETFLKGLSA